MDDCVGMQSEYAGVQSGQPYKVVEEMEILGLAADRRLCFGEHIDYILDRVKVRLAFLGQLAGCKWGAELGLLRCTWGGSDS